MSATHHEKPWKRPDGFDPPVASAPEGFTDVTKIQMIMTGSNWKTDMRETVTIRAHNGIVIDVAQVTPDGNFIGDFGKIRKEDLGEYVLRLMGRWTG